MPFIAAWPGTIAPGTSEHVAYFGDIMATMAELSAQKLTDDLDSITIVPTLLGNRKQKQHDYLYWEFHEGGFSQAVMIGGRWKGIRLKRLDAPIQIYDLEGDPAEERNIAAEMPEKVSEVARLFRDARSDSSLWPIKEAP